MSKGRLRRRRRRGRWCSACWSACSTASCGWCSRSCRSWPSRSGRRWPRPPSSAACPTPEPAAESVVIAPWPAFPAAWQDAAMEGRIGRMQELVRAVREVRNRYKVDSKTTLDVFVRCSEAMADDFRTLAPFIAAAGRRRPAGVRPGHGQAAPVGDACALRSSRSYVSLEGLIDAVGGDEALGEAAGGEAETPARGAGEAGQREFRGQGARRRWCSSSATSWRTCRIRSRPSRKTCAI